MVPEWISAQPGPVSKTKCNKWNKKNLGKNYFNTASGIFPRWFFLSFKSELLYKKYNSHTSCLSLCWYRWNHHSLLSTVSGESTTNLCLLYHPHYTTGYSDSLHLAAKTPRLEDHVTYLTNDRVRSRAEAKPQAFGWGLALYYDTWSCKNPHPYKLLKYCKRYNIHSKTLVLISELRLLQKGVKRAQQFRARVIAEDPDLILSIHMVAPNWS